MPVVVVNVGSTSVKYHLFDGEVERASGLVERVGGAGGRHVVRAGPRRVEERFEAADVRAALERALGTLLGTAGPLATALVRPSEIAAVGHRVVHGGEALVEPVRIDVTVKAQIAACARYAPIHNPKNLAGIEAAEELLPDAVQVATFDTAFHATLPPHAFRYALPEPLYGGRGIRRFGFHGHNHAYMALRAAELLGRDVASLRLVTCHLGGGASVCAVDGGRSVETSMGMTPLEGLVMGTRAGDLDPAVVLALIEDGRSAAEVDELLNGAAGLLGVSGLSADFRDLARAADGGHEGARLAIAMFVHRLRKYVGAYAAVLGGFDAIVLSGGIGENAARVRAALCERLGHLGVALDAARNAACDLRASGGAADVAADGSAVRVLVVEAREELMIARAAVRVAALAPA